MVSVNNGNLLAASKQEGIRILNQASLPAATYEALLLSADLMLSENRVSVGLGKAVCGGTPCGYLANRFSSLDELPALPRPLGRIVDAMEAARPGFIYPHEVFPIWGPEEVEKLGQFRDNSIVDACRRFEIFGGDATREELHALLTDASTIAELKQHQHDYWARVDKLPDPEAILATVIEGAR